MKSLLANIPRLSYALFAAFLVAMAVRSNNDTTVAIVASSVLMFAFCWANASHLLGIRAALKFVLIAVTFGWFAEQTGVSHGWFFGRYVYTDVLGWRLGDVPVVIPLMWFALCYTCYVISNLIVWRSAVDGSPRLSDAVFMSLLAAMIVTAFDLGADPYMVYTLKAWIMAKTDGWWFGETIQGFFGWVFVACAILFSFRMSVRKQVLRPLADFNKWHALLPLSAYASAMVFQLCVGHPMETRTIAVFAMGIPLLCALAGWQHWKTWPRADHAESQVSRARAAHMRYLADPLADTTMATILGPWPLTYDAAGQAAQWQKIAQVNRQFEQWKTNLSLLNWQPADTTLGPDIHLALQQYLQAGQVLPAWADRAKIERAEALFMDYGALSCSLLFCSSLPECYVVPDLSAVLHVAGQLEQHTDYRIRATAAMIFPVMMKGGLGQPDGSGLAQILKVRLIHATIRNLILRGSPQEAMHALGDQQHAKGAGVLTPLPAAGTDSMYQSLFAHGWKLGEDGLPCNQEELAYTLLTFSYVFLRSMRRLGLGLPPSDEEAYLHAWNVVGHVLGIRRELMADSMTQAEVLFTQMQARGRANPVSPDARPALGKALMTAMEQVIPFRLLKPVPVLMTRYLCGSPTADTIGLAGRVSWLSHGLFVLLMLKTRIIDGMVRLVWPEFSISRLITRVLGYHFMSQILLDQTRPLKLPQHLLNDINSAMATWDHDPKAPQWLNNLEDRMTKPGKWNVPTTT